MASTSSESDTDLHAFEPAPANASRSPCPALNACAAHGYLPRSGRHITFLELLNAIRAVYNTSLPLALLLTCAGFLFCGRNGRPSIPFLGTIDLHDLARHGRIEHDTSLAHADAELGAVFAPITLNEPLLSELLRETKDGKSLNMEDFARVRSKREDALRLAGRELDSIHAEITRGEVALILAIIGDGEAVSTESLRQWLGEDRLPDGWKRPEKVQGLLETVHMARRVEAAVKEASTGTVAGDGLRKLDMTE